MCEWRQCFQVVVVVLHLSHSVWHTDISTHLSAYISITRSNSWARKHQYNNPSTEPFKGFIDPSRQPVEVKRNKKWGTELSAVTRSLTVWTERSWRCRTVFVSFIWHFYDHVSWWCIHFWARLSVSASWLSVSHGRHDSSYLWKQNIVLMPVERAVALRRVAAVFALALPDTFINASTCRKDRRKTSS